MTEKNKAKAATAYMDEDAAYSELKAAPGRKYAEQDTGLGDQWTVSMYAGERLKRGVPSIPIASFYGLQMAEDAQLFAAASHMFEMLTAQEFLFEMIDDYVAKESEGKIQLSQHVIVRRVRSAAQLARWLALGVEVVEFSGSQGGIALDKHRMAIRDAMLWLNRPENMMTALARATPTTSEAEPAGDTEAGAVAR